jgi:hypothetical protein
MTASEQARADIDRLLRELNMHGTFNPSEQARLDAIADAETFVINSRMILPDYIRLTTYVWSNDSEDRVTDAIRKAQVAFRAVPGLRGEDTSGKR